MKKIFLLISFLSYLSFVVMHEYIHYQEVSQVCEVESSRVTTNFIANTEHTNFHFHSVRLRQCRDTLLHKLFSSQFNDLFLENNGIVTTPPLGRVLFRSHLPKYLSLTGLKSVILIV